MPREIDGRSLTLRSLFPRYGGQKVNLDVLGQPPSTMETVGSLAPLAGAAVMAPSLPLALATIPAYHAISSGALSDLPSIPTMPGEPWLTLADLITGAGGAGGDVQVAASRRPGGRSLRDLANWFGESKAVDEAGRPQRVFHGTNEAFEEFSPEAIAGEPAFFFTANPEMASKFAAAKHRGMGYGPGANVRPAYLNMQDPLVVDYAGKSKYGSFDAIIGRARREGKDGVIIQNVDDPPQGSWYDPFGGTPHDVYVALKPEQVKPAFGEPFKPRKKK